MARFVVSNASGGYLQFRPFDQSWTWVDVLHWREFRSLDDARAAVAECRPEIRAAITVICELETDTHGPIFHAPELDDHQQTRNAQHRAEQEQKSA